MNFPVQKVLSVRIHNVDINFFKNNNSSNKTLCILFVLYFTRIVLESWNKIFCKTTFYMC